MILCSENIKKWMQQLAGFCWQKKSFCQKCIWQFTYSAPGPFTKNKETIKKFKETGDNRNIHQNELDKECFQYNVVYGAYKYLIRRKASDKVLSNNHLKLLLIHSMMDNGLGLHQWSTNVLIKDIKTILFTQEPYHFWGSTITP